MFGINPGILLVVGIAWLTSLAGVGVWQNRAGHTAERGAWQEREYRQLTEYNARILELTQQRREAEERHAQRLSDLSTRHQQEMKNAKAQRDRDVAAAYSGGLRLQFHPTDLQAGRCATPSTGPAAPGRDGGAPGQLQGEAARSVLPPDITAGLLNIAHDADDTARQLKACQDVILEDRRLINEAPSGG